MDQPDPSVTPAVGTRCLTTRRICGTDRAVISEVVADTERAFDDGWPAHSGDLLETEDPATRFRTAYGGGAGVVDALHRLARRGFAELRRDYVPYLERARSPSGAVTASLDSTRQRHGTMVRSLQSILSARQSRNVASAASVSIIGCT
jgi:hypothetical protein